MTSFRRWVNRTGHWMSSCMCLCLCVGVRMRVVCVCACVCMCSCAQGYTHSSCSLNIHTCAYKHLIRQCSIQQYLLGRCMHSYWQVSSGTAQLKLCNACVASHSHVDIAHTHQNLSFCKLTLYACVCESPRAFWSESHNKNSWYLEILLHSKKWKLALFLFTYLPVHIRTCVYVCKLVYRHVLMVFLTNAERVQGQNGHDCQRAPRKELACKYTSMCVSIHMTRVSIHMTRSCTSMFVLSGTCMHARMIYRLHAHTRAEESRSTVDVDGHKYMPTSVLLMYCFRMCMHIRCMPDCKHVCVVYMHACGFMFNYMHWEECASSYAFTFG